MDQFERLLLEHGDAIARFVYYKVPLRQDAEDLLQETYLTAHERFHTLRDPDAFKAWVISIARNKINDYFRQKARQMDIPLDEVAENRLCYGRCDTSGTDVIEETLNKLKNREKQILYLYFFQNFSQCDIARKLGIPEGTVKSRLYHAKQHFKENYPYPPKRKGDLFMKNIPNRMPDYRIEKLEAAPFPVHHEELPGMLIVPRIGEKLTFASYDDPDKKLSNQERLQVKGPVTIHGVQGVEIEREYTDGTETGTRTIFAQLTDSFCRYLGGMSKTEDGGLQIVTFMDGDAFTYSYEVGEDNCGFPVERTAQGQITETDTGLTVCPGRDVSDIVGRYRVELNGKNYDTVRLVNVEKSAHGGILTEQYLDQSGRTVLWRRFNHEAWKISGNQKPWSAQLPDSERLLVNGEVYVHWYDCITEYVL